jgi:hypothetical protein
MVTSNQPSQVERLEETLFEELYEHVSSREHLHCLENSKLQRLMELCLLMNDKEADRREIKELINGEYNGWVTFSNIRKVVESVKTSAKG